MMILAMGRLRTLKTEALYGGGLEHVETRHKKGRKTARETGANCLDEGSFVELDMFASFPDHGSAEDEGGDRRRGRHRVWEGLGGGTCTSSLRTPAL